MKKICVLTGTRAEYSLLYHTMKAIEKSDKLKLQLIVTGSHLSHLHGNTVEEIKKDGFDINAKIDMRLNSSEKKDIAASMGILITELSKYFNILKPDILLILGDRYEILAAASCAVAMNIPIAHIGGGEATEGLIDEQVRHAVTKMAHIHFATTDIYKQNIINMGEERYRVLNVGAPVCENIKKFEFMSVSQLEAHLNIKIKRPFFVVTYHPVTLLELSPKEQITPLLSAIKNFDGTFVFTGANADFGGCEINEIIKKEVEKNSDKQNYYFFQNVGKAYLSLCRHADIMLGNSSSGIIETPCVNLPAVNIGDRQKGRLRHDNIIDVLNDLGSIQNGIEKALYDKDFKNKVSRLKNLYGDGRTSDKIIEVLEQIIIDEKLMFKKLVFERE